VCPTSQDTLSEWLRRWTRNPLASGRRGSNPLGVAIVDFAEAMAQHAVVYLWRRGSYLRKHMHNKEVTKYTWPGSNWRPSACEADVIATRPQVLLQSVQVSIRWGDQKRRRALTMHLTLNLARVARHLIQIVVDLVTCVEQRS
jgi:hypothetical protein